MGTLTLPEVPLERCAPALVPRARRATALEEKDTLFFPSPEKLHADVFKGVRNISNALEKSPTKFLVYGPI